MPCAFARGSTRGTSTSCESGSRYGSASTPTPICTSPATVAQISPLGVMSKQSNKVRAFVVLINIEGSHANLMPDLSASLDVVLAQTPAALVVPLDAVRQRRRACVRQRAAGLRLRGPAGHARCEECPRSRDCIGSRGGDDRRAERGREAPDEPLVRGPAPPAERRPRHGHARRRRRRGVCRRARQRRAGPADRRSEEGGVRRHAGDPRRHQTGAVDRAVVADAVGRSADREAGEERRRP